MKQEIEKMHFSCTRRTKQRNTSNDAHTCTNKQEDAVSCLEKVLSDGSKNNNESENSQIQDVVVEVNKAVNAEKMVVIEKSDGGKTFCDKKIKEELHNGSHNIDNMNFDFCGVDNKYKNNIREENVDPDLQNGGKKDNEDTIEQFLKEIGTGNDKKIKIVGSNVQQNETDVASKDIVNLNLARNNDVFDDEYKLENNAVDIENNLETSEVTHFIENLGRVEFHENDNIHFSIAPEPTDSDIIKDESCKNTFLHSLVKYIYSNIKELIKFCCNMFDDSKDDKPIENERPNRPSIFRSHSTDDVDNPYSIDPSMINDNIEIPHLTNIKMAMINTNTYSDTLLYSKIYKLENEIVHVYADLPINRFAQAYLNIKDIEHLKRERRLRVITKKYKNIFIYIERRHEVIFFKKGSESIICEIDSTLQFDDDYFEVEKFDIKDTAEEKKKKKISFCVIDNTNIICLAKRNLSFTQFKKKIYNRKSHEKGFVAFIYINNFSTKKTKADTAGKYTDFIVDNIADSLEIYNHAVLGINLDYAMVHFNEALTAVKWCNQIIEFFTKVEILNNGIKENISVSIGLDFGEYLEFPKGEGIRMTYAGQVLNQSSRIGKTGYNDMVMFSREVAKILEGRLEYIDLKMVSLGRHKYKGLARERDIFSVKKLINM